MTLAAAQDALKTYFGYESFRPLQKEVIDTVLSGRDALVLMPTGGGKSMCYQLPALVLPGMAVIISPLIALMRDQVTALQANGVAAAYLNSSQSAAEQAEVIEKALVADLKLLYVSPEKALSADFFSLLTRVKISLFAIDEAHCISAWGHDFRPEYTQLAHLRERFTEVPFMALTATADKPTRRDITLQLRLRDPEPFVSSFDRPNLSLNVLPGRRKLEAMVRFLEGHPSQAGIVYCQTRKTTEEVADKLRARGWSAAFYHAGMSDEERSTVQDDFVNDRVEIVCATIAFGMGIDKSNVRWVIHYNLPKNLENYYQEIGRAGRDGLPSDTLLFYSYGDVIQHRYFIAESNQQELLEAKLQRMEQYANARICRRRILLSYFGEEIQQDCGNCDVCQNPPKRFDATVLAQKAFSAVTRLKESVGMNMLIDVLRGSGKKELRERGYDQIKTYGAGADMSLGDWQHCLLQLLQMGYLEVAYHEGHTLKLTNAARAVLFDGAKVELVRPERKAKAAPKPEQRRDWLTDEESDLFERLRQLRLEIARTDQVPPYVVFSDATLRDMAQRRPHNESTMRQVAGVGQRKWERYGQQFLQVIREE